MSEAVSPIESAIHARRIGDQCRATGLGIVNNAPHWGKAELAGWLSGPYRRVTLYAADETGPAETNGSVQRAVEIASGRVESLLAQLREEIGVLFLSATLPKIEAFSRVCETHGFVVQRLTEDGSKLYLPFDQPRMRLLERVVSLFAADALMHLEDYATR